MKISIIIPIYNSLECVERCVHSVQAQTYEDVEIILVDDGSTDGTAEIVDRLAAEDGRTVAFHKANGGSSSARNFGIEKSTGDYLGFVDSDDFIEPDMFRRMLAAIEENNVKIVQAGRDEIDASGEKRDYVVSPKSKYCEVSAKDFLKELLLHVGDCSFCTKLVKRELFDELRFPEGELNEDFWLLVQMLANEKVSKIGIIPFVGYHVFYRETSNSRTTDKNYFPGVFTDIVVNADRMEKLISSKYPEMMDYVQRFALVQRLDYILHIPVSQMTKDNSFYNGVKTYLKVHKREINSNPYLNDDQRSKLKLLGTAPKLVRTVHMIKMKIFNRR